MKKLTVLMTIVMLTVCNSCSGGSNSILEFEIVSNNVTIWESARGEYYIILAVESTNLTNKPMYFKESDFDIVDEKGTLIDTIRAVKAYPSTVVPDETAVYYDVKVSNAILNKEVKLIAIPHIETEKSKIAGNQLRQLGITGATTGGSLYASGTVVNMSPKNECNNVNIAIISRMSNNQVVSVMTTTIDSIKPGEEIEFEVRDRLEERDLGPDIVTDYQHFAYIDPLNQTAARWMGDGARGDDAQ
jgi:hypothetical protein